MKSGVNSRLLQLKRKFGKNESVAIVAVCTLTTSDGCHPTETNVNTNAWQFSAPKIFALDRTQRFHVILNCLLAGFCKVLRDFLPIRN